MSSDLRRGSQGGARGEGATSGSRSALQSNGEKPTIWDAVTRLVEVSQRLMLDRFELVRIETRDDMQTLSRTLILVLASLPVLLLGWISLLAGLVVILDPALPMATSLIILGILHGVGGGLGTYIGVSRLRAGRRSKEEAGNEQEEV